MQPETIRAEAPSPVKAAFWISLVSIALTLLRSLFSLIDSYGDVNEAVAGSGVDPDSVRRIIVAFWVVTVIIEFLIVLRMRAGARWARVLLTLLLLLQLISNAITVARPSEEAGTTTVTFDYVADSVVACLAVLTLGLLYTKSSRAWFRKR